MYLISCWIEHPVRQIDQPFTYTSDEPAECGMRVRVNFAHREVTGFVESCEETDETPEQAEARLHCRLKPVLSVLDQESLITPELHDLALWMKDTTLSTTISCFQAMLPGKIKPITSNARVVMEHWAVLSEGEFSLTPKQLEAFQYVKNHQPLRYSDLRKQYPNQARALIEKGAIHLETKEKEAVETVSEHPSEPLPLTKDQQSVYDEIRTSPDMVFLLRGVTGSGKTEVYLHLAEDALSEGRQVLILVPEISLTPQMIERVSSRFGTELAIYHSGLNPQEKYEQYRMVRSGRARVVVGTRSSVFLPFQNLGLIVMDEEQDTSYKQENQPAYHCRDIAIHRGAYHHCKVVLGSATPALESYARALKHVYHLVTLDHRINDTLPEVTIIPLKEAMKRGESYILSNELKQKIQERLALHQQVILLLNRRGYSTSLRCCACQEVLMCPHCDLALSYHRQERLLKCHTCGYQMRVPAVCPSCGAREGYSAYGFGTEKLEQEVQAAFPEASILRMDADTTGRKNAHAKILNAFGRHEADILLGTQMIAKGLDYPDVTLVGILNGDEGLSRTDYRSCELTFDLLMQASGRSGRSEEPGEVVLQVFDPDHYAVQCAAHQDYDTFFAKEMQFRHAGMYPPYTYLIAITVSDADEAAGNRTALWLKNSLHGTYKTIGVITLLKIQDRFRFRILLKGRDLEEMRKDVRALFRTEEYRKAKDIRIDVNPMTLD